MSSTHVFFLSSLSVVELFLLPQMDDSDSKSIPNWYSNLWCIEICGSILSFEETHLRSWPKKTRQEPKFHGCGFGEAIGFWWKKGDKSFSWLGVADVFFEAS